MFMFAKFVVDIIAAFAAIASAAPALEDSSVAARIADAGGNIFFGTDVNFTDFCDLDAFTNGECITLVPDIQNAISSFGPDPDIQCTLYSGTRCTGQSITLFYPGVSDLSSVGFDNTLVSYDCTTDIMKSPP